MGGGVRRGGLTLNEVNPSPAGRPWLREQAIAELAIGIRHLDRIGQESLRDNLIADGPFGVLIEEGHSREDVRIAIVMHHLSSVESIRALLEGAPAEWARAFEEGSGQ